MEGQIQDIPETIQIRAPVSIIQQPGVPQRTGVGKSAVKRLAAIELVIGVLTVFFGVALVLQRGIIAAHGIVGGLLICAAGCLGSSSLQDPKNHCKNGVHMGFSIVACCVSAIGVCIYSLFLTIVGLLRWFWGRAYGRTSGFEMKKEKE